MALSCAVMHRVTTCEATTLNDALRDAGDTCVKIARPR